MQNNNTISLINSLNNFSFDSKNVEKLNLLSNIFFKNIENNVKKNIEKNIEKPTHNEKSDFFTPLNVNSKDTLFWCWYIFNNGYTEYNLNKKKPFIIEKKEKIEWITLLRENKQSIKQLKFKLSDLENNLANEQTLNIKTLIAICYINCIDIFVINGKTFYQKLSDSESEYKMILKYDKQKRNYSIFLNTSLIQKTIDKCNNELFFIDNISKPLKSISSYKSAELQNIAEKLNIPLKFESSKKNKTKKILYNEIQEQIV